MCLCYGLLHSVYQCRTLVQSWQRFQPSLTVVVKPCLKKKTSTTWAGHCIVFWLFFKPTLSGKDLFYITCYYILYFYIFSSPSPNCERLKYCCCVAAGLLCFIRKPDMQGYIWTAFRPKLALQLNSQSCKWDIFQQSNTTWHYTMGPLMLIRWDSHPCTTTTQPDGFLGTFGLNAALQLMLLLK